MSSRVDEIGVFELDKKITVTIASLDNCKVNNASKLVLMHWIVLRNTLLNGCYQVCSLVGYMIVHHCKLYY